MIDFIKKLQNLPRAVRVQIMWLSVTICTAIIFVFWVWSLGNSLNQPNRVVADQANLFGSLSQVSQDIPTLWQSLSAGFSDVWQSVKDNVSQSQATDVPASPSPSGQASGRLPIQ